MPTFLPRRSAGLRIFDAGRAMSDVSGRWTSAPTATTFSPWSRARSTSGSYEIAMSVRPAATCRIGAAGSEGARIFTSSPTARKRPLAWAS